MSPCPSFRVGRDPCPSLQSRTPPCTECPGPTSIASGPRGSAGRGRELLPSDAAGETPPRRRSRSSIRSSGRSLRSADRADLEPQTRQATQHTHADHRATQASATASTRTRAPKARSLISGGRSLERSSRAPRVRRYGRKMGSAAASRHGPTLPQVQAPPAPRQAHPSVVSIKVAAPASAKLVELLPHQGVHSQREDRRRRPPAKFGGWCHAVCAIALWLSMSSVARARWARSGPPHRRTCMPGRPAPRCRNAHVARCLDIVARLSAVQRLCCGRAPPLALC